MDICYLTAVEMAAEIRAGHLSAREIVEAHLAQVDAWNPRVNAIVTLDADGARAAARAADDVQSRGGTLKPLHGLPIVHKDLFPTRGMRTTFGSPLYADNIPDESAIVVEREQAAGAIALGKSNTPEFGAGSQTFNRVFGPTRNPWDLAKTCGGSTGGGAVALACGMTALADGSDMGASLRNPASFCNVVALRPTVGRVPSYPVQGLYESLGVTGPMARTVADVALLLSVIAGPDARAPMASGDSPARFAGALDRDFRGVKIAATFDFGGLPVESDVVDAMRSCVGAFGGLGANVVEACPDLSGANEIFGVLRALAFVTSHGPLLDRDRSKLKDTVIWNIEAGRALTGERIGAAERARTALFHRMRAFMRDHEFLIAPVSQVAPFPVEQEYPTSINGVPMESYIDWMRSCFYVTVTGHPAISVPCGFTPAGLPVGLQIVGRFGDDFGVLQLAHAFEQATRIGERRPALPARR